MNFSAKLLLGSITVLVLSGYSALLLTYNNSKIKLREEFAQNAEVLAANLSELFQNLSDVEACEAANSAVKIQSVEYLVLTHNNKEICVAGKKPIAPFSLTNPKDSNDQVEKTKTYTTFTSVECNKLNCSPLEIELGISFQALDKSLQMVWLNQIITILSMIIFASIFLIIFSYFVKTKLERLANACLLIQKGELNLNLNFRGTDEISKIANSMDKMTNELRNANKEKEIQWRTAQQTSKMVALGEMAAGVAHEINNPLMVIGGKAQIALKKINMGNYSVEDAKANYEKISDTVVRIAKIVSGLRTFSRQSENDPFLPVSINQILSDSLTLTEEKIKAQGIAIEILKNEDFIIECRAGQISQVLLNLIGNAADAIQNLPNKWIKIDTFKKNDFICLRVTDSGEGIPQEIVDKIMHPFFTTKEVGKGTGLGLSISNGLIQNHKGSLAYELNGGNTSFIISLPVKQKQ